MFVQQLEDFLDAPLHNRLGFWAKAVMPTVREQCAYGDGSMSHQSA
jgi:hypothetical protein